tara:strand:- start:7962 stop:8561 length:600 start_codon:yes stop_codon:yes gene_type:complete
MTIFSFPSIIPASSSFELVTNTKTFRSPLTNSVQTASRKGSLWKVGMSFNNLHGSQRAEMQAFLTKLNGQEHRFALYDHSYARRGGGTGTLSVNGANQGGSSLVCVTEGFSITGYLKAGDYISFNNELHMVTDDANSDGAGAITLKIAPPIRKPTINNQSIDYDSPVNGVFMLSSKSGWTNDPAGLSSFSLDAFEDVLA